MNANNIEYQSLLATGLDKALVAEAATGWMEANAAGVIYKGGNTYKVAKIDFSKKTPQDYNKAGGYVNNPVSVTYEEHTFDKDWDATLYIDAMDVDETNFIATATTLAGEQERTIFAPAVDGYRLTKLAKYAADNEGHSRVLVPTSANIYSELKADMRKATAGRAVKESDLRIHIAESVYYTLCDSKEVQKTLPVNGGAINFNDEVKTINNAILIPTADNLMVDAEGNLVNWIVMGKQVPVAITKHNFSNIFDPSVNQKGNGYTVVGRLYHTLNVNDNQIKALYACTNA